MPESWVRSAILVRINSLIRGHSGVRWELLEAMSTLLKENITPVVPLRGSISASGGKIIYLISLDVTSLNLVDSIYKDLSPLSYVAGTLIGNPYIRVWDGPVDARQMVSSPDAYQKHNIQHLVFSPKEHLGLLNGTAFSAAVAALALHDAVHMALLSQVLTAMGTEALLGTQGTPTQLLYERD